MLNIGKLGVGGERYYLDTVASGREDYYTGAGEAPGYWLGEAARDLGLVGLVEPEALRAVLAACHPETGEGLTARPGRKVPGFDLTFRAPKSVSLVYGLGDGEVSAEARRAHDAAVVAALRYLEREAGWSRRGTGGVERVPVGGFVAAAFRHRSSRAGDPLLHTHVVVANVACAVDDGKWRTLDARHLYLHAKTAGYLYQAHLRYELTRRLGVEWGPVVNGCADVAGIPREVIGAFSRRRAEITAAMAERGESSARAAQTATLATRKAKDRTVTPETLQSQWHLSATLLGFTPEHVAALLDRAAVPRLDERLVARIATDLAGPAGLTERASTFSRRDVLRAWCERLPAGTEARQVEALTDAFLDPDRGLAVRLLDPTSYAAGDVVRRGDGRLVKAGDEPRYSTPELLALEQRVLDTAVTRADAGVAVAEPAAVAAAVGRRPSLSTEQAAMVERLTTSGAGVDVVVGKAGAGKTFALDAARAAWQASDVRVIGCALAARAAVGLEDGAGIPSVTLDRLLADLDRRHRAYRLPANGVVVVDEAGMVGTRKLAALLDHAEQAHAKVVLVGDHRQLPEIDAGGVFRGLAARLPAVELTENRRQREGWERDALDQLRDGDPEVALDAYAEHGRVVTGDTAEAVRERLVADWWSAHLDADADRPGDVGVMVAARRSDVDDLNARARHRLTAAGTLTGPTLTAADRDFQAGDEVLLGRNDRRLAVVNGDRGRITTLDPDARSVTVALDRDTRTVTLPTAYLDAGHLSHGYAVTAHKAQGATVDQAWVLGSDAAYREWGYVALSRARDSTRLYVVDSDPGSRFVDALGRSNAQDLATDHGRPTLDPHAARIAALQRQQRALARELTEAREHRDACQTRLDTARAELADLDHGLSRWRHRDRITDLRRDIARTHGDLTEWDDRVDRLTEEHATRAAASAAWEHQRMEVAQPMEVIVDSAELADEHARRVLDLLEGPSRRGTEHRPREPAVLEVGLG